MFDLYGAWIGTMAGNGWQNWLNETETKDSVSRQYLSEEGLLTAAVASAIIRSRKEQFEHRENAKPFRDFVCQEMEDYHREKDHEMSAAVYVSPCGMAAVSLKEAAFMARVCAEAVGEKSTLAAEAVASVVFLAKMMKTKGEIGRFLKEYYMAPDVGKSPVSKAISCFLASTNFWDTIRRVLMSEEEHLCETATIAGAVAWCYFTTKFKRDKHDSRIQKVLLQAEQHVPDKLKTIDREFSDMCIRREGTHFRTGFCTSIMSEDEELELLRKEKEEVASGLRKMVPKNTMPTDDTFMITAASKTEQVPVDSVLGTKYMPIVRAVEYLEENEDHLFVKEDRLVMFRGRRMAPVHDFLAVLFEEKTNDQQQGKYTIREVIDMMMESQEFCHETMVPWNTTAPGRIESKIILCSPTSYLQRFPRHSIWEAKRLPQDRGERYIGCKSVYYDQSLGKTRICIQLDPDRYWFLSIFFNSENGELEKYSLDAEDASDSHYEFVNEAGVRKLLYQKEDEHKYLEEILIRFIAQNSGGKLLALIRPYITAQFYYD